MKAAADTPPDGDTPPGPGDSLGSAVRLLPHGIAIFGPDRRLRFVNDAYLRIMAGTPGAIGDTLADIVQAHAAAGEFLDPEAEAQARRTLDLNPDAPPLRRRRPNGATIEVRTDRLPEGGHLVIVADITMLAEAQAEITRCSTMLESVIDHIPTGISVYGPDRRLALVNDAYTHIMTGAPIEIGETVDDIIDRRARSGEYGAGDPAELARSQRQRDKTRPQFRRRRRPNGNIVDVRTAPLPDGSHISVVSDVTPLITAETELARRADALEALLAHVQHGIILWDQDHRIIAANAAAAALLQAPDGLLVPGRSLADAIQNMLERGILGDGPSARQRAQWLAAQDRTQPQHERRTTRSGRQLDIHSAPTPQGGFVTTYVDVTDASIAEEALRLSKLAADAANAAKSRFVAAMSRDLRTPLMTILEQTDAVARDAMDAASARLARTGPPHAIDTAKVAEACGTIGTTALGLLGSIDTILDVIRLESGQFDLADDQVDVPSLLRNVLRRFDAQAAGAEVTLVIDVPKTMPSLRADEQRLHQALSHTVTHAIAATGPMGSVTVAARHDWARGNVLLDVTDNGPKLAEAELEQAFEPFGQLTSAAPRDIPEAALGLYVARTLMRAHGGDLTLRSMPATGTIATLLIPANRVLQDPARDTN